jgi:hypothetical protein
MKRSGVDMKWQWNGNRREMAWNESHECN